MRHINRKVLHNIHLPLTLRDLQVAFTEPTVLWYLYLLSAKQDAKMA